MRLIKYLRMPSPFSMDKSFQDKTIRFLRRLIFVKPVFIAIDYSKLRKITKGEVTVFYAQIEKGNLEFGKKYFRSGKLPKNKEVKELLTIPNKKESTHQLFYLQKELSDAEKAKLLYPDMIDKIVGDLRKIGISEYYFPFNTFLTELIANAVEHGIQNKNINWWLTQDLNRVDKKIVYTFVDMGIGIVQSHKKAGLPFHYNFFSSRKIVKDAFLGKLGSSTKEIDRGKGLPQIRDLISKNIVSDATIITNNVSLTFNNNYIQTAQTFNFVGTYYTWTISANNVKSWKMNE